MQRPNSRRASYLVRLMNFLEISCICMSSLIKYTKCICTLGFFAPVLSYGLMIAMVFAFMAPIMLGVCSVFFWTATKVHMHNALFVYCQRCEGGKNSNYSLSSQFGFECLTHILSLSPLLQVGNYSIIGIVLCSSQSTAQL